MAGDWKRYRRRVEWKSRWLDLRVQELQRQSAHYAAVEAALSNPPPATTTTTAATTPPPPSAPRPRRRRRGDAPRGVVVPEPTPQPEATAEAGGDEDAAAAAALRVCLRPPPTHGMLTRPLWVCGRALACHQPSKWCGREAAGGLPESAREPSPVYPAGPQLRSLTASDVGSTGGCCGPGAQAAAAAAGGGGGRGGSGPGAAPGAGRAVQVRFCRKPYRRVRIQGRGRVRIQVHC
jgi:hypothetical protein